MDQAACGCHQSVVDPDVAARKTFLNWIEIQASLGRQNLYGRKLGQPEAVMAMEQPSFLTDVDESFLPRC